MVSVLFALLCIASVAEVLYLLFLLLLRVLSALAAPPWCVSSAYLGTPAVSTRCLAAGCPSGVPLLAPLFRMADCPGSAPFPPMSSWLSALHRGAGGWAPSSGLSGFRKWVPSPSGPFPAVLCPSIGRPGGTGVQRLGCRVAAAGLLSALPRHSSCSIIPIPMPSSSPISIPGAALGNISLVLVAKDALELAPLPSPGFYGLLFVVL